MEIEKIDMKENFLKGLRIADLDLFITAAHTKNLGKSAHLHHLSQSAASTAIQRVETAFGIALCTHEKRQFRLTREGQLLFPKIESWVKELRELILIENQAPIRFATTHAIAHVVVPPLLSQERVEFKYMRPDQAYTAILHDKADIALVLDNAAWKGVSSTEVSRGHFQLYARNPDLPLRPVLLPEDQMEVLSLQQNWLEKYGYSTPVKARIPSWSLIATICSSTDEVGFLPDFLAQKSGLHPVLWQPETAPYRVLALFRHSERQLLDYFMQELALCF